MHPSSTSAVRLLAAWQQRRRELSDRLDTLLLHGPTAVARVAARADELRAALDAERASFEAFVAVAQQPADPQQADVEPAGRAAVPPAVEPAPAPPAYPRLRSVGGGGA